MSNELKELTAALEKASPDFAKDAIPTELKRFLVAHGTVEKALESYTAYRKWRVDEKVDGILENPPKEAKLISRLVPAAFHGTTLDGRPVYIEKTGRIMCAELAKKVTAEQFARMHVWGMEVVRARILEQNEKSDKEVSAFVSVLDLTGLSLGHKAAMHILRKANEIDELYYPEMMSQVLVINAPYVFSALWRLMTMFLSERVANKLKVLSTDHETELLKLIAKDQLPKEYGGECVCSGVGPGKENESIMELVDLPTLTDEQKEEKLCVPVFGSASVKDMGLKTETVGAGARWNLVCTPGVGGTVSYYWDSEGDYDINFSVFALGGPGKKVVLKKEERTVKGSDSFEMPEGCNKLVLHFDNSFSYFNSKVIRYEAVEGSSNKGDSESKESN